MTWVDRKWKMRSALSTGKLRVDFRHCFDPKPGTCYRPRVVYQPSQRCQLCLCPACPHMCKHNPTWKVHGHSLHSVLSISRVLLAPIIYRVVCHPRTRRCILFVVKLIYCSRHPSITPKTCLACSRTTTHRSSSTQHHTYPHTRTTWTTRT